MLQLKISLNYNHAKQHYSQTGCNMQTLFFFWILIFLLHQNTKHTHELSRKKKHYYIMAFRTYENMICVWPNRPHTCSCFFDTIIYTLCCAYIRHKYNTSTIYKTKQKKSS